MEMEYYINNLLRLYRDEIYRCREAYHNSLLENICKLLNKEYEIGYFKIQAPRIYSIVWNTCKKTIDRLSDKYHYKFISNLNDTIENIISEIEKTLHKILKVDKLYGAERPRTESVDRIGNTIANELASSIIEIFSDIINKRDIIEVLLTLYTQIKDLIDELYNLSKEGEPYIHSKEDRLCLHGALLLFYLRSDADKLIYFRSKFIKIIEGIEILKRNIGIKNIKDKVRSTILGDYNPEEIIDIFKIDNNEWLDIESKDMIDILKFLIELYRFLRKEKMEIGVEVKSEHIVTEKSLTEIQEGLLWIRLLECGIPSLPDIYIPKQWDILSLYPKYPYMIVGIDLKIRKNYVSFR